MVAANVPANTAQSLGKLVLRATDTAIAPGPVVNGNVNG